jgi:hypothetical protein
MKIIDKTQQYDDAILYGAMLGKIMFMIADKVYISISTLIDRDFSSNSPDLLTAYFMKIVERKLDHEGTLGEYYDDAKRLYGKYQDVIDPNNVGKINPALVTGKEALEMMCDASIKIILEQLKKLGDSNIENTPWQETWFDENELGMTTWVSLDDAKKKGNKKRHTKAFRKNNLIHQPYFNPTKDLTDLEKSINNRWGKFAPFGVDPFEKEYGANINFPANNNKLLWQRFIKITPASFGKDQGSIYHKIENIEKETSGQYTESGPAVFNLWPAFYSYNLRGHVNIDYWEEAWMDFIQSLPGSQLKGSEAALGAARHIYRFPNHIYKKFEYGVRAVLLCDEKFFGAHKSAFSAQYDGALNSKIKAAFEKTYGDSAYLVYNKQEYGIWPKFLIPIAEVKKEYNIGDLTIFKDKGFKAGHEHWDNHQKISWEAEARVKMVRKKLETELPSLQEDLLKTNEMRTFMEYIFPYHLLPQMSAIYCIESLSNALMSLTTGGGMPSLIVNLGLDTLINKIRYPGVYMKNE